MPTPKAFALLGPTACGKTALALKIAETLPVEIISLDSALVYRDMDIGTAKPSHAERSFVPHHLIDIITPVQTYSAARFVEDCTRLIGEITARGKYPLIVGGTMMYFRALTQGLNDLPEADACLRADLDEQKQMYGLDFLYRTLQKVDPETACRLKPNDSQRIGRALEVYYLTGKPMSTHLSSPTSHTLPFDLHTAALIPENRARLHENIALRFHLMLEQGFIGEVENLRRLYPSLTADSPAIRCVGYRQAWEYLDGKTDFPAFVEKGIAATRQLAKRQLTWLRKTPLDCVTDPFSDGNSCTRLIEAAKRFFGA